MIYKHLEGSKIKAVFSKEKPRPLFRYWLEVYFQQNNLLKKTACVILQNPSYADHERADKTIQFMEKIVFQIGKAKNLFPEFNGVHRLIIVNLFAFRQTNGFEGKEHHVGPKNDAAIKKALKESDIIIIGWGKSRRFRNRQDMVVEWINQVTHNRKFVTASHPSRAQYQGFIKNW